MGWEAEREKRHRSDCHRSRVGGRRAPDRKHALLPRSSAPDPDSREDRRMIDRIDISGVLKTSVCDLYSNLVTRPTGAAVRIEIEHLLDDIGDRSLVILDFSHVGLLDFSCADEIVAKLLLQYVSLDMPRREVYFLFYGMSESHMDAIETVLERHDLALVTQRAEGGPFLMGIIDGDPRRIWETMRDLGTAEPNDVATAVG